MLADYESEELDLNNPDTFRDLSKPMGALHRYRCYDFVNHITSVRLSVIHWSFMAAGFSTLHVAVGVLKGVFLPFRDPVSNVLVV